MASDCLEFKKIQQLEKRRSQDERDIHRRVRVFARMQTQDDYRNLVTGLHSISTVIHHLRKDEFKLRQRISLLQEYKKMGITTFRDANEYDREKVQRVRLHQTPMIKQNVRSMMPSDLTKQPRHTSRQPRTSSIYGDDVRWI